MPGESASDADFLLSEGSLDEAAIYEVLKETSLEKWHVKNRTGGSSLKSWASQEAVNCVLMSKELASKLETAKIIPFYADYLDVERTPSLGLSLDDCCIVYEPQSSGERQCRIMKQVPKGPACNIYTYIARPLSEPVLESALSRVWEFLRTTFTGNAWALECTIAGIALALMGQNVDRAFWSIGKGGVGQSLFSTLIHNAISPMHGFFDCTSLYMDDELRKTLENSVGFCVNTAQEATEGGTGNIRNLRQDLYKKLCSSDPISCRPPYERATKMLVMRGMLRFELNSPLTFSHITEDCWDSIYRRSLVMEMKGQFLPAEEYELLNEDERGMAVSSRRATR